MPISTNGTIITRVAGALYGEYLSNASYNELVLVSPIAPATVAANFITSDFMGRTDAQLATTVLTNLGLSSITGLNNWLAAQMTAAGSTAALKGAKLVDLLNSFSTMTTDATYGSFATTFNNNVSASLTYSQTANSAGGSFATAGANAAAAATAAAAAAAATAAAAAAATAAANAAAATAALTLTTAIGTSTGTAGDDTFTAASGTWNTGDVVNGGSGNDTLNATISGTGPTQSATSLVSVETLNLTASPQPATLDLTGVTGVTAINNVSSANGASLTVSGVGNPVNTTITGGGSATTITYGTAVTAATALTDAATLTLNGTAAGTNFTGSGVEIMTIASNGTANTLTTFADTGMIRATITGSQALTIGGTFGGTTLTTVNASAATGALTINQLGAGAGGTAAAGVSFTGGSGVTNLTTGSFNDTVTLGNAAGNILVTSSGNDTITTGTGSSTVTPGAGNDTVNLLGSDTVRFDESGPTNADIINGFSLASNDVIALRLGSAQAAATTTTAAVAATAGTFGIVQTNATTPTLPNVNGVGTGTAIALQNVFPNATASSNTVLGTSNVLNVSGVLTDGTAQGIINVLGTTATGAGITTTPNGKFVIVAYTAGNVAQIWQYLGDGSNLTGTAASSVSVDGAIQANELALVATLNGISPGSLTAAAFSTYLTPGGAVTTVSTGTGQVITLTGLLNTVQSTANAAGQFLTSANDTINVAVGTLPTGASTTTTGLTIIDSGTSDADVLNATVLGDWAAGTILSGMETVNLNMLVAGTTFSAAARTPGTTTFGLTGSQNFVVSSLPASPTISLNSTFQGAAATAYSGAVTGSMNTTGAFNVALNGVGALTAATSTAASSVTAPSLAMITLNGSTVVGGVGTTSTVTVTGTNFLQAQAANANATLGSASLFGVPAGTGTGTPEQVITLTGAGALTIVGGGAVFNQAGITTNTGWTGSLTLRPTDNTAFDMTGITTGSGSVVGVNTIDLSTTPAPGTITLAAANGNFPVTLVSTSPTNIGSFTVGYASTSPTTQNNQLVVTESNASANVGALRTPFVNTLTINLGGTAGTTATKTLGNVTMDVNAANQNLTITSNAASTTAGVLIADTVTTTGVAGTFTGSFNTDTVGNGGTGSVFNGNATQASFITGTPGGNDLITTGSANDSITLGTGNSNATGGLGNDTYIFVGTTSGNTIVTDAGGTDALAFTNTSGGNASTINSGATFAAMSVERLMVRSGQAITVAPSQVGAQNINGIGGTTVGLTLSAAGALNASTLTFTQANGVNASGAALTGSVPTAMVLTGTATADTITASTTVATTVTPGAGGDTIALGTHTVAHRVIQAAAGDSATFALQSANSVSTVGFDVISGLNTGDTLALAAYTGTANATAANSVLVSSAVSALTSVINTGTTAGVNQINQIRGTYSSSANTFVGAADGADLLLVYDGNALAATTALEAIVLVGLGGNTIGIAAGAGGILSIA